MMATARNPARDAVAFVGVGTTPYLRDAGGKSATALACDAARTAIEDAGVDLADIDGICGSSVPTVSVQAALGLPAVTWWSNSSLPFSLLVIEAMNAVFSGACTTVLVYHSSLRGAGGSKTAAADPFRVHNASDAHGHNAAMTAESPSGTYGYCAWAQRYLDTYGVGRDALGLVAINGRANAARNPHALFREPLSMEQYLGARMIREPLCVLDMDPPVDAGDAFVLTTAERARDLGHRPVLLHAATSGRTDRPFADQLEDYTISGKEIVAWRLWEKSDVALSDVDVFFPYDGFSIMALSWVEAVGYCQPGEAGPFLAKHWSAGENRVLIDGRVPINTHGGSLSEGATQGAGHFREAVTQLRGDAGERQVPGAATALVTPGGFLWNATGFVLRGG
jgi:acetyl-CoA acetyltransferase